jgi:hypothetical protein
MKWFCGHIVSFIEGITGSAGCIDDANTVPMVSPIENGDHVILASPCSVSWFCIRRLPISVGSIWGRKTVKPGLTSRERDYLKSQLSIVS